MSKALFDIDLFKILFALSLNLALCPSAWGQVANSPSAEVNDQMGDPIDIASPDDDDPQGPSKQGKVANKIPKQKKEKRGSIIIAPIPI
jgi:hypothetical protein